MAEAAADQLLADPAFSDRAQAFRDEMAKQPLIATAVTAMEQVHTTGEPVLRIGY
ncbi:MAG: hypothetical protein NVS3B21_30560 [Acidimicrobiales bacterium]